MNVTITAVFATSICENLHIGMNALLTGLLYLGIFVLGYVAQRWVNRHWIK